MTTMQNEIFKQIADITFENGQKLTEVISDVIIKGNSVGFSIDVAERDMQEVQEIRKIATEVIEELSWVKKVTIVLTGAKKQNFKSKFILEGVKKIILVAAGKGGVGKSTIAALIARELSNEGYRVGVADADIYGPSMPLIFGINERPEIVDNKMIPLMIDNIAINSIGFLMPEGEAIAWRGPMASKAIYQLLFSTDWGNLDYLIIDTPPGTGDIHLSILENYQIDGGAIIVTTPQKVSGIDAEKAINLYKKFEVPFLGIIENMSYLIDNLGNKATIFKGESGQFLSEKHEMPLLLQIPIISELSESCDIGQDFTKLPSVKNLSFGSILSSLCHSNLKDSTDTE